jgi:transcriptional regulator with XRE-family HTH domain
MASGAYVQAPLWSGRTPDMGGPKFGRFVGAWSMRVDDSIRERRTDRSGPLRVFLSHTAELRELPEGRSFVAAAEAAVIRARHAVTDMAYFTARDGRPAEYCERMVTDADVYVGIIGMRYGSTVRGKSDQSYTELEYETATSTGLPRLLFMVREKNSVLPPTDQPVRHTERQAAFRRRLLEDSDVTVAMVTTPADLEIALFHALIELPDGSRQPAYPNNLRRLRGRRFTVPEMARRIGVSDSTYKSWERGEHRPFPRNIRALCAAFGVQEHELGYGSPSDTVSPRELTATMPRVRLASHNTRWGTSIGSLWFPWVVASFGPYRPASDRPRRPRRRARVRCGAVPD